MATQTEVVEAPKQMPEPSVRTSSARRVHAAQALALIAVLAAVVGALGPAKEVRTTYSWPPRTLPEGSPTRLWYTPLLLTRRVPEAISARVPCGPLRALPQAGQPVTVLATSRHARAVNGLEVTRADGQVIVQVGTHVLDRVALPRRGSTAKTCALELELEGGTWSLSGPAGRSNGRLSEMPVVNGVFSGLDLKTADRPSIDIAVVPQSVRPIGRQTAAWVLASACAFGALLLISLDAASVRRRPRASALRDMLAKAHPADAVIVVLLLGWAVLSPANPNDGWFATTERMYPSAGGFSNYFNAFATNLPLGYWRDWLQHWVTGRTTELVITRIPALVCLLATWALCRWALARVLGARSKTRGAFPWVLAAMFAVAALSWGMTLRPEPAIAVLTAGVLASMVAFVERQTVSALAPTVVLVPLAVTAHPAGVVSLAPLLASAPTVVRWSRSHLRIVAVFVAAAFALALTLATVGSDAAHRHSDSTTYRASGVQSFSWYDELRRYEYLSWPSFGTPLRRASVALMVLVLFVALLRVLSRTRGESNRLLGLPSRALAIGLALLVLDPDKLSWHFGGLIALGSVAAATEATTLWNGAQAESKARAVPFLWVAGAVLAAAWSWSVRADWNPLDLRTLHWTLGFESTVSLSGLAPLVPLIGLLGVAIAGLVRAGGRGFAASPLRLAPWSIPLVAVPVLVFTIGVLAADAAKTDSWTLTTQNLDALHGAAGCGLADDVVAPVPDSLRPLQVMRGNGDFARVPAWVPQTPVRALPRFVLDPDTSGTARTPWFLLRTARPLGVLATGLVTAETELSLQFAQLSKGRAQVLATQPLPSVGLQRGLQDVATWLFLKPTASAPPPPRADAVRIALGGGGARDDAVAVTAPAAYEVEPIARTLRDLRGPTLTNPFVFPYFPCAREPVLRDGAVAMPTAILSFPSARADSSAGRGQVFTGALDEQSATRLPLVDSRDPYTRAIDVVLYDIEPIPGAVLAPPNVASST